MKVWILLLFFSPGFNASTTIVIDNIATLAECERVRSIAMDTYDRNGGAHQRGRCIEVNKVAR